MNVILLEKVQNLGSLGDQVQLSLVMLVTSYSHRVKQFQQLKITLKSLKHAVLNLKRK